MGLVLSLSFFLFSGVASAWNPQVTGGRCKQQTNKRCRGTIGNAGGAGACCDPQSPSIATCAQNNPCVGGTPQKWPANKLPLSWFLNANNMAGSSSFPGATETDIANALKLAFDAWTKPTCTSFTHYQDLDLISYARLLFNILQCKKCVFAWQTFACDVILMTGNA